ncbi:MAG: ABC transporter ATP-binding protein [Candidatus Wallbacteria bacterium]|nr:ABC transporter ATP-binding protein [Candidatus Wallbacteria bacterium]
MEAAIEACELVKVYGATAVVDRVSIAIRRGEIYGFLGPNGAGKTTTLRMLTGLLKPTSGTARVAGLDVALETDRVKGQIGYMSQAFGLYRDLTVAENLYFYGRLYLPEAVALARQRAVAGRMGLEPYRHRLARELSGGWRQRLALGCALLHEPKILFLDEPTAGIDPVSRRELWDLLYELVLEGMTLFVTTHYMEEAERCNRIGFIAKGRLLASDTPRALRTGYLSGAMLSVRCEGLQELHARLRRQFPQSTLYGNEIHLLVDSEEQSRPLLECAVREAGIGEFALERIQPTIEDVFVHLTRGLAG